MTGKMLDERLGKVHFWLLFIGFHTTFLIQHWLGVEGMPRRYADYLPEDGFTLYNQISSIGAFVLGASMLVFLWNVWVTRKAPKVQVDDPWGYGGGPEGAPPAPPLPQPWGGAGAVPRRYADYLPEDGFTLYNQISSIGAFVLGASMLVFLWNVWVTRKAPKVQVDDPWGYGGSLEWATSCPPPRHNFHALPRIRSERPAFDLHHPSVTKVDTPTKDKNLLDVFYGEPDLGDR